MGNKYAHTSDGELLAIAQQLEDMLDDISDYKPALWNEDVQLSYAHASGTLAVIRKELRRRGIEP